MKQNMNLPAANTAQKTEKLNSNRFIFEYLLNLSCYGTSTADLESVTSLKKVFMLPFSTNKNLATNEVAIQNTQSREMVTMQLLNTYWSKRHNANDDCRC